MSSPIAIPLLSNNKTFKSTSPSSSSNQNYYVHGDRPFTGHTHYGYYGYYGYRDSKQGWRIKRKSQCIKSI